MYRKDFKSGTLCPGIGFRFFFFECNLSVMQESLLYQVTEAHLISVINYGLLIFLR